MSTAAETKLQVTSLMKALRKQASAGDLDKTVAARVRDAAKTVEAQAKTDAQRCSAAAYVARIECQIDKLSERARARGRLLTARAALARNYGLLKEAKTLGAVAALMPAVLRAAEITGTKQAAQKRLKAAEDRIKRKEKREADAQKKATKKAKKKAQKKTKAAKPPKAPSLKAMAAAGASMQSKLDQAMRAAGGTSLSPKEAAEIEAKQRALQSQLRRPTPIKAPQGYELRRSVYGTEVHNKKRNEKVGWARQEEIADQSVFRAYTVNPGTGFEELIGTANDYQAAIDYIVARDRKRGGPAGGAAAQRKMRSDSDKALKRASAIVRKLQAGGMKARIGMDLVDSRQVDVKFGADRVRSLNVGASGPPYFGTMLPSEKQEIERVLRGGKAQASKDEIFHKSTKNQLTGREQGSIRLGPYLYSVQRHAGQPGTLYLQHMDHPRDLGYVRHTDAGLLT